MCRETIHRIHRFFRSRRAQNAIKIAAEWVAFALLAWWLYVTFIYQKPDSILQAKLKELLIATLASGALLHAWQRWPPRHKERELSGEGVQYFKFFHVPLWLAWLGLSVVAWAIFGQDMIWNLERRLVFLSTPSGVADPLSASVDWRLYVAVLALIISVITGFYLGILHRATDKAEKVVERLQDYETKLAELAKKQYESADEFAAMEMRLRGDILIPILTHLSSLWETKQVTKPSSHARENLSKLTRRLQAEMVLYKLSESDTGTQFLIGWEDVRAYEDIFHKDIETFHHLFRMAERRLDTLFQQGKASRDDEKLCICADLGFGRVGIRKANSYVSTGT
jgi:hypothetical protein